MSQCGWPQSRQLLGNHSVVFPGSPVPTGNAGPPQGISTAMSDILTKITRYKLAEIAEAKRVRPRAAIEEAARRAPPVRSFAGALERRTREGQFALIAEIKKAVAVEGPDPRRLRSAGTGQGL